MQPNEIDEHVPLFRRGTEQTADVVGQTRDSQMGLRDASRPLDEKKTGTIARRRDIRKKTGRHRERVGVRKRSTETVRKLIRTRCRLFRIFHVSFLLAVRKSSISVGNVGGAGRPKRGARPFVRRSFYTAGSVASLFS